MSYHRWPPYVPVAQRRARAAREMQKLRKKGLKIEPVEVQGLKIARTFWGKAWCDHLEKFSDFANRLPRGRTYVRNGSVCHLAISKGKVEGIVSGTELYKVKIKITPIPAKKWKDVLKLCAGQIGSMLELLQGRLSGNVMGLVTDRDKGLFPGPSEIEMACDCPDWAGMCKHIAAVLYGVGARLDRQPELLFLLRNVDHRDLIATQLAIQSATSASGRRRRLAGADLSDVFGVDIDESIRPNRPNKPNKPKAVAGKKVTKRRAAPTAASVSRLRKRLGLSRSQFARLAGVSPPTVTNWEKGVGRLNLRQHSRDALTRLAQYTPEQAAREVNRTR